MFFLNFYVNSIQRIYSGYYITSGDKANQEFSVTKLFQCQRRCAPLIGIHKRLCAHAFFLAGPLRTTPGG